MPTKVTEHFTVEEFTCHDGTPYPVDNVDDEVAWVGQPHTWYETRLVPLCTMLEVIRTAGGDEPLHIDSGYRDEAYDQKLYDADAGAGNVASPQTSQHPKGRAADIKHKHLSPRALFTLILSLYQDGQLPQLGGIGLYPTFVHVDVRPRGPKNHLSIWGGTRPSNIA